MKTTLTTLFLTLLLAGCAQELAEGPPAVRYGQDECAHCGMIVNEERHAAAITYTADNGQGGYLVFDDIGDLIDYERDHPELKVNRRYVHDLNTKAWVEAPSATILHSRDLHTPMGSGLAGFATREAAALKGSQVMTWSQAVERRIADTSARQDQDNVGTNSTRACCSGGNNDSECASNTHAGR